MDQANEDFKLFRQALIEAMDEKSRMILEKYPETPVYSKRYIRAMNRILSGQRKPSAKTSGRISPKKRLIAALVVAVLLLLGGLTVYAKREAVVEFFEQIHEKFTRAFYRKEQENGTDFPDTIEEERIPTYVPEGFVLQDYQSSLFTVYVVWQNEDESITFNQDIIGAVYNLDNEHSSFTTICIGDYIVYAKQNESMNTYIWNDGIYSYSLDCPASLVFEDVSHMILSVSKIK